MNSLSNKDFFNTLISNTINGNLQCKENVPPSTSGCNVVSGNMEDQCKNCDGTPAANTSICLSGNLASHEASA